MANMEYVPKECVTEDLHCTKCGGEVKLRYPGNDPENGPARHDCPKFHIEDYEDRKFQVLIDHAVEMWELIKLSAYEGNTVGLPEFVEVIQTKLGAIKF